MLRSRRWLRYAAPLASLCLLAACSDNGREPLLSQVETIDIPAADTTTRTNVNISNPTLDVPTTYPVADGDLLTLVWSDEFDGAQLDPETWFFESGDGSQYGIPGWGNNELQWYLPDNARLENGKLIIEARRETVGNYGYTSARITTQDRLAVRYGRIEASIKLPAGQGIWPAFWMLPQDDEQGSPPALGVYGGFSASGEIDIMEAVNLGEAPGPAGFGGGNTIFGTIHFGGEFPANQFSTVEYEVSESLTDGFNTFAVEWDEFEIRWFVNGILFAVQNSWSSSAAPFPAPFDQPFEILLNLAVGGNFPGSPDGSTPFPATMEVDYVRVYSGEEPAGQQAAPGVIPDDVIYATDPNEPVDLVFGVDYTGFDPFGSGSVFNSNFVADSSFVPAFAVTTGNGYGAQVGQLGIFGFAVGFADAYDRLEFKAKNLNNNLIRVKFNPDGDYVDVDLTSSSYSTALGDDWYQVSIPIADFTGTATATTLLFETDNTAAAAFTFLLTDIGFSGAGGGGGGFDSGLLTNGDFEAGTSPWLAGVTNPIGAANVIDDGTGNQVFFVDVMAAGNPFDVNLSQKLAITPDETYTLTFRARSNVNRTIVAGIGLSGGSFANTVQTVNLTTAWQTFTLDLTATGFGDADSRVLFDMGAEVGEVYIDEVSLVVASGGGGFDPGLLTNGDFEAGTSPWLAGVTNPIDASNVIDDGTGNMVFFVDVTAAGNSFDVNLSQKLAITPDETYTLTFMARSNVNRTIVAGIGLSGGSFANTVQTVNLTTAWQTFTLDLTATGFGDADSRVLFDMGAEVGEVYIDDVSLVVAAGGGGGGTSFATNGDFEAGDFSGWQQFVNSGVQMISNDTPANGGSFSAALSGNTAPGNGGTTEIKQANVGIGTLQVGDVLTINFDVKGTFGPGGQLNVLSFTEFGGGGADLSDQTVIAGGVDNWTNFNYNVTLSGADASGGFSLAFNPVCGAVADCVADVFIDNVSIELN